jgi:DNA helicase HerA-like ATPase
MNTDNRLGVVISGSLSAGIEVRLDGTASVEDIAVGRYVTIEGHSKRFLGMITDVGLQVTDPQLTLAPPEDGDQFTTEVLAGTSAYGTIKVTPYKIIGGDTETITEGPQPVKTIPSHFSTVRLSSETDIEMVFGKESKERFWIGSPLDMETKLCLDLPELVRRSNGIFGKSGTGKTYFTRWLLAGMLQKSQAVNLIFDMQNEYGWAGTSEKGTAVKGLKQFFPARVAIFTLDAANAAQRQVKPDFIVKIGYDEIEAEDISILQQTLKLSEQSVEAVFALEHHFGKDWITRTLAISQEDQENILQTLNIHDSTFKNLKRGLNTIARLPFMQAHADQPAVEQIMKSLEQRINVVLEFGSFRDITTYILVANLLARRIYDQYQYRTEKALAGNTEKPTPLVITIEEAHKFLNSEIADQTIFGTIAREMRKYNVTLLVIDQRPSGINEEIMSQLGTKVIFSMDNEHDIDSVLSGISGKGELKGVLSKLAAKQQALILGHAVPMPVAFKPREYGSKESYQGLIQTGDKPEKDIEAEIEDLWR